MKLPPGNWFAPPGSNRNGGGGNETVGAFDIEGRKATRSVQAIRRFSPDGRWLAYCKEIGGQLYVTPFPGPGARVAVSSAGGRDPRWRGDGKELYYLTPDGKVMVVPITPETAFHPGTSELLFQSKLSSRYLTASLNTASWDVDSIGNRFLLTVPASESPAPQVNVIFNWTSLLKK